MKRFFSYTILSFFLLLLPTGQASANNNDSIRLSLLTCAPGEEIYSLFGHTAIRYENSSQGIDVVFNYGLFSFNTPNFISASRSEKQTTNWEQRIMNVLQLNTHFSDAAYGSKRSI